MTKNLKICFLVFDVFSSVSPTFPVLKNSLNFQYNETVSA